MSTVLYDVMKCKEYKSHIVWLTVFYELFSQVVNSRKISVIILIRVICISKNTVWDICTFILKI